MVDRASFPLCCFQRELLTRTILCYVFATFSVSCCRSKKKGHQCLFPGDCNMVFRGCCDVGATQPAQLRGSVHSCWCAMDIRRFAVFSISAAAHSEAREASQSKDAARVTACISDLGLPWPRPRAHRKVGRLALRTLHLESVYKHILSGGDAKGVAAEMPRWWQEGMQEPRDDGELGDAPVLTTAGCQLQCTKLVCPPPLSVGCPSQPITLKCHEHCHSAPRKCTILRLIYLTSVPHLW